MITFHKNIRVMTTIFGYIYIIMNIMGNSRLLHLNEKLLNEKFIIRIKEEINKRHYILGNNKMDTEQIKRTRVFNAILYFS